ncbi:MAG: FtsX-like permease family protein [Albidovulum sp.]
MKDVLGRLRARVTERSGADRVVPASGHTATLTGITAAIMAFLAVFALALSLTTGRLADRWAGALSKTATIRISAPAEQLDRQTNKVIEVLQTTPGVANARALGPDEIGNLLEPWIGPDLPVDALPIPRLVAITEEGAGFDAEGLKLRLAAEAPGAVLDDHLRWRKPLVEAAGRIRALGLLSLILIGGATAAMVTLASQAALAANSKVISVLRLVGARDTFIARAFVRRFTSRAFFGALIGTLLGMIALMFMPEASPEGGFLTGLGFVGLQWLLPFSIPVLAAIVAFGATRAAAFRSLRMVK